jgi:hypothetical protein
MHLKLLAFVFAAALAVPAAASASDPACHERHNADCKMPCCQHDHEIDGIAVLLGGGVATAEDVFGAPVRQQVVVWFHRPVWVGQNVLMGQYIIEHDTNRQARGEPCTHIYAANDPSKPVVTFHCTHLEAGTTQRDEVVVRSTGDGTRKFVRFQFAGEDAAHGFPAR